MTIYILLLSKFVALNCEPASSTDSNWISQLISHHLLLWVLTAMLLVLLLPKPEPPCRLKLINNVSVPVCNDECK